jgi:hypothetical protein
MFAISNFVGTYQNTVIRAESSRLAKNLTIRLEMRFATTAVDIVSVYSPIESLNLLRHEAHNRGIGEDPFEIVFATLAVSLFMDAVSPLSKVKLALRRHLARELLEVIHPPRHFWRKTGSCRVILDFLGGCI